MAGDHAGKKQGENRAAGQPNREPPTTLKPLALPPSTALAAGMAVYRRAGGLRRLTVLDFRGVTEHGRRQQRGDGAAWGGAVAALDRRG